MPKPAVVISVVAAVLVLVVAGVLLSALGDSEPAPPPPGYATFSATFGERTVSFAYPRAWGDPERRTEKGVQVVAFFGPRDADGVRSVVRLTADPETDISFASHYSLVDAQDRVALLDVEEIAEQDVDVPGAEAAKRRVLEYDLKTRDGVQRSRASTIFALADDGLFVGLVADTRAAKPDVDANAVLASLRLAG